jgi:adenine-specific DNA-methyltransferase
VWLYFRGKRKGEMLELFQTSLSEIPIARDADLEKDIARLTRGAHESLLHNPNASTSGVEAEVNELVFKLYGLDSADVEAVQGFVTVHASSRKSPTPSDQGLGKVDR